jgi:hypothetical protein
VLRGDTVEAVRKSVEKRRAKRATDASAAPAPEKSETETEDDVDDLEAKGRFAY